MARTLRLEVGKGLDPGRSRDHNQDSVFVFQPTDPKEIETKGDLYTVADGMGGGEAGARASDRATRKIHEEYYYGDPNADIRESLQRAVRVANTAVRDLAQGDDSQSSIGTTFTGAIVRGNQLFVANVGDSRAYLVRDGAVRQITQDHSWVAERVRANRMTPEQARTHPWRNRITRCLGTAPDVQADVFEESLRADDVVVLCTDGLHGVVQDGEIGAMVTALGPEQAAEELVKLANDRGGPDNIGVVVLGPPRRRRATSRGLNRALPLAGALALLVAGAVAFASMGGSAPTVAVSPTAGPAQAQVETTAAPVAAPVAPGQPTPTRPAASSASIVIVDVPRGQTGQPGATGGSSGPTATIDPNASQSAPAVTEATPTLTQEPRATTGRPGGVTPSPTSATPTPTLSPTPTPALAYPPPVLAEARSDGSSVLLSWSYGGKLAADEWFDVIVWPVGSSPRGGKANVREMSWRFGGNEPGGEYNWTIAVIRKRDNRVEELVRAAGTGRFSWQPAGSGGAPCERDTRTLQCK